MSEPWNLTEAQRRQFREAHGDAKRARMTAPDFPGTIPAADTDDPQGQEAGPARIRGTPARRRSRPPGTAARGWRSTAIRPTAAGRPAPPTATPGTTPSSSPSRSEEHT